MCGSIACMPGSPPSTGTTTSKPTRLLRLPAETGNAAAQGVLCFLYTEGYGVPRSWREAAFWCERAAEQGNVQAQYMFGLLYNKGHGVPENYILAYKWLNLAASRASGPKKEYSFRMRDCGRDENVPRADRARAGALAGVAARARDRRLGLRPGALEFLVGTARGSRAGPRQAEDLDPRPLLQRHLARPHRAQNPAGMFLAGLEPDQALRRLIEEDADALGRTDHRADQGKLQALRVPAPSPAAPAAAAARAMTTAAAAPVGGATA